MFAAGSRRANWDDNDEKNCLAMRNTMRAIVVADKNRAGVGTVETPTPGADEIRVRVKAAALNRADLLVLAGHQQQAPPVTSRGNSSRECRADVPL